MSNNIINIEFNKVKKTYKDIISIDMEYKMLKLLSENILAPQVISINKNTICMEYIKGNTVLDVLSLYDQGKVSLNHIKNMFDLLIKWIGDFNKCTFDYFKYNINLTDFHFSNFIYDGNKITGIDFERYEKGSIEDNYISLISWLYLYDFTYVEKFDSLIEEVKKMISKVICLHNIEKSINTYIDTRLKKRSLYKNFKNTSCIIMAGGQNKRMGSYKSELLIGKYTFLDHLLYQNSDFDDLILSVNNKELYKKYNRHMVSDVVKNIGPIGGLYSVLNEIHNDKIFVCTCDSPCLSYDIFEMMFNEMNKGYDGVVACYEGRVNPLLAMYKRDIVYEVEELINKKTYKLMCLLDNLSIKYIEIGHLIPKEFININTVESYNMVSEYVISNKNYFPLTTFIK